MPRVTGGPAGYAGSMVRWLAGFAAVLSVFAADAPVRTITLDTPVVNRFLGLGVQWDPHEYEPSDAAWALTLKRVDYLRPAFLRVMWWANPYCLGFDDSGNPQYVWQDGEAKANARLRPLLKILDYAESRKIDVMLGEWQWPVDLGPGRPISGPEDPRWARMIADFVHYLTRVRGYSVIRYYNFMNEPNGNWMWRDRTVDYDAWKAGVLHLRSEFDARGLRGLPIAGPDNSADWGWLDRTVKDIPNSIGFWDMHWYVMDRELREGAVEKLLREKRQVLLANDPAAEQKGLYMGEVGILEGRANGDQQPRVRTFEYGVLMADFAAQIMDAGWMGASAWDLDDAMHVVNGRPHPDVPDDLTLKTWGFWNTQGAAMGHPEDEAMRPWFYTWSSMTRLFPKGARIYSSRDRTPGVRAVMGRTGSDFSVMAVNNSDQHVSARIRVPGMTTRVFSTFRYFDKEHPVNPESFPMASGASKAIDLSAGADLEFPSRGVIFLTTFK